MDFQSKEKQQKQHSGNKAAEEKKWDAKAEKFKESLFKEGMTRAKKVTEVLRQKEFIRDAVLDVGGGIGLYAFPFAAHAKNVMISDLSSKMLKYAKEEAEQLGLTNLDYVKLDWDEANIKKLGWENQFHLVFAAMCPAINSSESIDKMITASNKWCCINRMIQAKDHISEKLANLLGPSQEYNPQNDREIVQAIFNDLWDKGYEPQLDYVNDSTEKVYTIDEATAHYGKSYQTLAQDQDVELRDIISDMAENNQVKVINHIKIALLSWQV